ncbi:MAG: hypothetical protein AAGG02_14595, partial [Cyanobacteria bacterium P01_H01_bin.15]
MAERPRPSRDPRKPGKSTRSADQRGRAHRSRPYKKGGKSPRPRRFERRERDYPQPTKNAPEDNQFTSADSGIPLRKESKT